MPLYEYTCNSHGSFDEFRPASSANAPLACPVCGDEAKRVWTVPRTRTMDPGRRIGMERNERSRHEPHVCGKGCSHHHHQTPKKPAEPAKPALQRYTGARPWVIEHA